MSFNISLDKHSNNLLLSFLIALVLGVLALLIFNLYAGKTLHVGSIQYGFERLSTSEKESLEERFREQLAQKDEEISGLLAKNNQLSREISELEEELLSYEIEKPVYSRTKKVRLEESFVDSKTGVRFSIQGYSEHEGELKLLASLSVPESGEFKRFIDEGDSWKFFVKGSEYKLWFEEIRAEEDFVILAIKELRQGY
ncbi:hypothetical protein [Idiomarina sp.]|uniref:hypothetical protein n=1 Tax=Idiomarina sp. TaxID=1874361 RepID=UPI0035145D14